MIELESLQFGNFRSFVDDQFISFENREKLIQIDGKNENTGGSSGAGKTTILMALMYLLDIGDTPTTVLQSRLTKEGLWAIGKFKFDGIPVTISRSKKDGLVIEMPSEKVSGNSALAEERLEQLIGLPKKIFKKMVHKRQKEGGFFLNMTPKEMYEFLIAVLGLEKHILHIDQISQNVVSCNAKAESLVREVQLTESSLLDMERILSEKKKPIPFVFDEEIKQLHHGVLSIRSNIGGLKMEVKTMIDEVPKPQEIVVDTSTINMQIAAMVPTRVALNEKLKGIEAAGKELEAKLNMVDFHQKNALRWGVDIAKFREDRAHIEKSQCPTCMQAWTGETAQQKIDNIDYAIRSLISDCLKAKAFIDEKPQIEENIARLVTIRQGINDELLVLQERRADLDAHKYKMMEEVGNQNQLLKQEYNDKCILIESKIRNTIDRLNLNLKQTEIDLSTKESQQSSYLIALSQYEKETSSLGTIIAKKKQDIEIAQNQLQVLKKQILVADESKRMIKAYVLQTFQETLDAIGVAATDILANLPNMNTSTVYFEGCKETKSGTIKDEIVAIINSDGINDIPIKSLSGGERTSIDLAVDLAVIDVIETKVSKGANFFFMDEPFDGLDSVCKENCLEILKQIDTNKKIIMVDHSSELKEMVSDVILVVKKGEVSTISA